MTQRVVTEWVLEREHAERDYVRHEQFTLALEGYFAYSEARGDDPGECVLDLDCVTWRGEPFNLTVSEEREIVEQWREELRNA